MSQAKKNKFGKVPLERALSKLGIYSRTETRRFILAGELMVNNKIERNPLRLVVPEFDKFSVKGKSVDKDISIAIMINKPKSVLITKSDEKGRKTIYDLLPNNLHSLHPVGRLDMASTGLLILTNDTKLSSRLTDPKNGFERTYLVTIDGEFSDQKKNIVEAGILDNGELLKPLSVEIRKSCKKESHLTVKLTEGKNREIRRMFLAVGYEVTALKRIKFGTLELGQLEMGSYRYLTKDELLLLNAL